MTKREANKLLKTMEKHMKAVAERRDKIDETISELENLRDVCERAHDALWEARDELSELV